MIKNLVCCSSNTMLEAMRLINDNARGICFVVDKENHLKGVVTDGDIRRALLSGMGLNDEITKALHKDFVYGYAGESYSNLISKLKLGVNIIPLVDRGFKVVDFFEYEQNVHFPVAIPNLNGNEFKYLTDAFLSTWISSSGKYIDKFEKGFSSYSDCQYGVSVSNGTVALHLALVALNIGEGDEVIVPNLTFAATINAVLHAKATPVIVDIEENGWCISPSEIEKSITKKTKAIVPVHLYGQPCDMGSIMDIANKYNLKVIEDCAEAHGAEFDGKKVGSFGDIGCFSFYGNKVITTGEGGMCTTNSDNLNETMKILRDHGMNKSKKYWHDRVGFNYRLTNLQASIGLAQLERIQEIHQNRRVYEDGYREILENEYCFQKDLERRSRITWLVSVLVDRECDRDSLISVFNDVGIEARPFFYPLSKMKIYKRFLRCPAPVSEKISSKGINLPTYESLKNIESIQKILKKHSIGVMAKT